jgi:hypothetical protein
MNRVEQVLNTVSNRAGSYNLNFQQLSKPIVLNKSTTVINFNVPDSLNDPVKRREMQDKTLGHGVYT